MSIKLSKDIYSEEDKKQQVNDLLVTVAKMFYGTFRLMNFKDQISGDVEFGDEKFRILFEKYQKSDTLTEPVVTVPLAVKTLTDALRDDPNFFYIYQSNIAMAFYDEYHKIYSEEHASEPVRQTIAEIGNAAAKRFLNQWIGR